MKKLLLGSAAIAGLVLASAPAQAQMELTIGGHSKNYIGYVDQDNSGNDNFGMARETELHFNGEATLDNGLTFGFQVETEVDGGDDANTIEESYVYLSGTWGRVNLGSENGAAYLLQVAAPSADSNIDGIRQYISPIATTGVNPVSNNGTNVAGTTDVDGLDYDNDLTGTAEKITYLSPNFGGFQVGASYTHAADEANPSDTPITDGLTVDGNEGYEVSARYEGVMDGFGYALGAGYTTVEATGDDAEEWNVGLDVDAGPFGVGVVYTEAEQGTTESDTTVVGVDYTTGPFKFGASYLTLDTDTATGIEADRYTAGVIYTAGAGLSFRGSVSQLDVEDNADTTSVLGGVQINF